MDTKTLTTLRTIAETGSFQAAANRLNYAQSTVTFQIQQLEQELSLQLFEKVGRRMVLTKAGKDILPLIDSILGTIDEMRNYGKSENDLSGELKISVPDTLLTYKMQPILNAFHNQNPNVQLSLQMANCFTIPQKVADGTVDLGIHYDVGGYSDSLVVHRLCDFSLVLVASSQMDPKTINLQRTHQRINLTLITDDKESIYHKKFSAEILTRDIVFTHMLEIGSIEAVKQSVISNLGVAYLPKFVVESELANNQLQVIQTKFTDDKLTSVYVHRKNMWESRAFDSFTQNLTNLL
ncbi:LysR family transcriptional regulator [Companilactobacillus keshanensis]|uniref:LysR family transcriptional regulator n=1 Tax=Companilactobacillus keshanensis TaxID=2486003 RepID=A0ABW4BW69_9LACO|nr:LysR family transcriptional regulator [Companilactobacillus keshanensis]